MLAGVRQDFPHTESVSHDRNCHQCLDLLDVQLCAQAFELMGDWPQHCYVLPSLAGEGMEATAQRQESQLLSKGSRSIRSLE